MKDTTKLAEVPAYLKKTNFSEWMQFIQSPEQQTLSKFPFICKAMKALQKLSSDEDTVREYNRHISAQTSQN